MNSFKKDKVKYLIYSIIGLAAFFLIWELSVRTGLISDRTMAPPSKAIDSFFTKMVDKKPDGATLPEHFWTSLKLALTGFGAAVIIGVPLGLLMGYFKFLDFLIMPLFEIIRPIPPIAWIPIVILTLGIGMPAKVFIIFIAAFVPCVINSYLGIKLTNQTLINVAKTFGSKDWRIFTKVCVPSAMSMVFAGIRISLGNSWSTLVAAEMLASIQGLGYMIQMSRTLIRPDLIIVGMFTIGVTGAFLGWLLGLLEKRISPWRYK